jgi:HAMP domain-containing protein
MGPSLYLARPIRVEAACLTCHGLPSAAPQTVIARYGTNNGFEWQANEVVGAQVVSVPLTSAAASAAHVFRVLMSWLIGLLVLLLLVINALLYVLVVRPLRITARVAEQLSVGALPGERFPTQGSDEIGALARAFERMRVSLEKAMKLLES